ncbi:sensor histidine kinase [Cyclobacterium plantarum]|uniref:histidine kinase n=1 Tax=Cyclobacterium plantarum TaxID=2716263 RepID=A0ABX0HAX8_9BACT|nr:ATP-binding protein [Cyclobacterium plantarum]NHE57596.1 GHKL domain-containing protein [Cyclobacterium plantarum]
MKIENFSTLGNKTNGIKAKKTDMERLVLENQRLLEELSGLQQINREYKSIIYHASHDLKGPLNNIVSLVNLMIEAKDLEEIDSLSKPVLRSISKFKTSLNELILIKKNENEPEKNGIVNIKTVLNEVIESINGQIMESGAVLTKALQITQVHFPRKNLRSILFNLISNAIKYKSADRIPTIHVSSFRQGEFVVIAVLDNGTGIRKENMDKLFTKFGTLHDESYPGESLGIGLFLVKKLLEESGGKIEVESEWAKGSVFNAYLNQK